MAGHPGTRSHLGAPSRTLDRADLLEQRRVVSLDPPSATRRARLKRITDALRRIDERSERRGA